MLINQTANITPAKKQLTFSECHRRFNSLCGKITMLQWTLNHYNNPHNPRRTQMSDDMLEEYTLKLKQFVFQRVQYQKAIEELANYKLETGLNGTFETNIKMPAGYVNAHEWWDENQHQYPDFVAAMGKLERRMQNQKQALVRKWNDELLQKQQLAETEELLATADEIELTE